MDTRFFIGLIASIVLVMGVATRKPNQKNMLFACGNAGMFVYALLGYLAGGSIFFLILQIFIAISTVLMLLSVPDRYDTPILALGGFVLVAWSLAHFQDYGTAVFVLGLALLGIGYAMNSGTSRREVALMLGSGAIAVFSVLMRDWIFTGLNVVFSALSLVNLVRLRRDADTGRA